MASATRCIAARSLPGSLVRENSSCDLVVDARVAVARRLEVGGFEHGALERDHRDVVFLLARRVP